VPLLDAIRGIFLAGSLTIYPGIAALVLAIVAIVDGLRRRDLRPLRTAGPLLHLAIAVGLAYLLLLVRLEVPGASYTAARLPLALIALAYGPLPGAIAYTLGHWAILTVPADGVWLSAFEGLLIGWLAISPNPFRRPGAASFNVFVGFALAWGTAGLAWLNYLHGELDLTRLLRFFTGPTIEALAIALLLLLIPPATFRVLFPASVLRSEPVAPSPTSGAVPTGLGEAGRAGRERRGELGSPQVPGLDQRERSSRTLSEPPSPGRLPKR
jgi:hypothetical protein